MTSDPGTAGKAMPQTALLAVLAVGLAVFATSLNGGFLADDFTYIGRFASFPLSQWPTLFVKEWSGGVWGFPLRELRPFAALSYIIDSRLWGGSPVGYRLTNLALHLASTGLVAGLAWRYSGGRIWAAVAAGAIFALHPSHVEAVTWITGRVDLIGTVAALAFIAMSERYVDRAGPRWAVGALVALLVGIFSKEFCMLAPVIMLAKWSILDGGGKASWLRRALILVGATTIFGFYAYCRMKAFGSENAGFNAWADANAWHRHTSHLAWLVPVLPLLGSEEWASPPSVARAQGIWLVCLGVGLTALLVARLASKPQLARGLFFLVVWYLLTVVPLMAVGYFTPRHLYFPSVGLAVALGLACAALPRGRIIALAVLLVPLALAHFKVLRPWVASGAISRLALRQVHAALEGSHDSFALVTSVPERYQTALLWAWAMPAGATRPFLDLPPKARLIVRVGNYVRPDKWFEELQPAAALKESSEGFAFHVDEAGVITSRKLAPAEMPKALESFESMARALSPEGYSEWVRQLASGPQ